VHTVHTLTLGSVAATSTTPQSDFSYRSVSSVVDGRTTGHVIGVETLDVPVQKGGLLDCAVTRWAENNVADLPYAFALRVFFNAEINGRLYGCDKCHIGQSWPVLVPAQWRNFTTGIHKMQSKSPARVTVLVILFYVISCLSK